MSRFPTSDAKLRVSMRVRLTELHRQLRHEGVSATMVYVTHDQIEAMTMGDRICVLNGGRIMQVDTPGNIYHHPGINLLLVLLVIRQ